MNGTQRVDPSLTRLWTWLRRTRGLRSETSSINQSILVKIEGLRLWFWICDQVGVSVPHRLGLKGQETWSSVWFRDLEFLGLSTIDFLPFPGWASSFPFLDKYVFCRNVPPLRGLYFQNPVNFVLSFYHFTSVLDSSDPSPPSWSTSPNFPRYREWRSLEEEGQRWRFSSLHPIERVPVCWPFCQPPYVSPEDWGSGKRRMKIKIRTVYKYFMDDTRSMVHDCYVPSACDVRSVRPSSSVYSSTTLVPPPAH